MLEILDLLREGAFVIASMGLIFVTLILAWVTSQLRGETKRLAKYTIRPKLIPMSYFVPSTKTTHVHITNKGVGTAINIEVMARNHKGPLKLEPDKDVLGPGDASTVPLQDVNVGDKINFVVTYQDIDKNPYEETFTVTITAIS